MALEPEAAKVTRPFRPMRHPFMLRPIEQLNFLWIPRLPD